MRRAAALAAGLLALAGPARAVCDLSPEPCTLEAGADGGSYHLRLPEVPKGAPAVIFLHGYGGSGGATIGNRRIVAPLLARGHAVIAPNGIPQRADGPPGWGFFPGRQARDERAFLTGVADDAARRFGLDRKRMLLAGFSSGGFMVTYLACEAPGSFAAFAPVAGGFWRPHPEACAGPVNLFHTHGWTDTVVPLEGRPLGGGRYRQGDIFAGLELFRAANGCTGHRPDAIEADGPTWRRVWTGCGTGGALELALFPGGHTVPEDWGDRTLDWFETVLDGGSGAGD